MTSLLTAATRFKRTKAAAVMRALLCWQDGKKKKRNKERRENEIAANEGSLPYEVWKGCAKAVSMCVKKKKKITKKRTCPTLQCCQPDATLIRRQRERTIRRAHTSGLSHTPTRCASQAFPTQAAYFAQRWTRCEEAFGCSGSHRRRQRSSLRTDAKLLESAGVVGTQQRRCVYLGSTCVTVAACRPGGGSAGSLSSWKNLYEK